MNLPKDSSEFKCKVCSKRNMKIRNCGFINAKWTIRGKLRKQAATRICSDGRTYDKKLYCFLEEDFYKLWERLDIIVEKLPDEIRESDLMDDKEEYDSVSDDISCGIAQKKESSSHNLGCISWNKSP